MKQRITIFSLMLLVLLNLPTAQSQTQVKPQAPPPAAEKKQNWDKVVMVNGEEMIGQVTEISDSNIKFIHQGETLVYTLKIQEVNKIQFASGRIEIFTKAAVETDAKPGIQDHHNVVAVLPMTYIGSGGSRDEKMAIKAQSDCFAAMNKKASQFVLQDPMTTNATLIRSGINEANIAGYTPAELCAMLGAEYILYCTITIDPKGSMTSGSNYFSAKQKSNQVNGFGTGSSSSSNLFRTSVAMKIYNDQGQNIFEQSHKAFWPSENAYETTLNYLLKRTPLYRK